MRIVRTRDEAGCILHLSEINQTEGYLIEGNLFGRFSITEKRYPVRERLAPLHPPLVIGVAVNYRAHALEMGGTLPEYPVFFLKMPHTLNDPGKPILLPRGLRSDKVDYEAELAVVIGKTCKNVSEAKAMEYVLGYTAANDITARDWQKEWGGGQFCRGKGFDSFCPLGPVLVTADELKDPGNLAIRTLLNGDTVQDSSTADLIFPIPRLVSFLSGSTTLPAGTVILTGTPSGVGAGRTPPRYLKDGDLVQVEVDRIGRLENPVREESPH